MHVKLSSNSGRSYRLIFVSLSIFTAVTGIHFQTRAENKSAVACQQYDIRVRGTDVRLRAKPTLNGRLIRHFQSGENWRATRETTGWYKIESKGYVSAAQVDVLKAYPSDCATDVALKSTQQSGLDLAAQQAPTNIESHRANQELTEVLARGAISLKEFNRAEEILLEHLKHDPNDSRAVSLLSDLKVLREQEDTGKSSLHMRGTMRIGYDSNVLLISDQINASAPGSLFVSPGFGIEGAANIGSENIKWRSQTIYTGYTSDRVNTLNSFYESLGAEWDIPSNENQKLKNAIGAHLDFSFVNTDGYNLFSWIPTAYYSASWTLTSESSMFFEVPLGYQNFPDSPSGVDSRDGLTVTPTVLYRRRVSNNLLSLGGNYQEALLKGDSFASRSVSLIAGASRPLSFKTSGRVGLGLTKTNYPQNSSDRSDSRIDVSAGLSRPVFIPEKMNLILEYLYSSNQSNISTASYNRHTAYLELAYIFQ